MNIWNKQYPNAPLHDPAGDWFVNRKDQLNLLWNWACKIPTKGSRSITGLRRTGKSTIMAKLYNRLYFEQERVMPIYITFADYLHKKEPITAKQFAEEFVAGAVRSYLVFKYKRPEFQDAHVDYFTPQKLAEELSDEITLDWFAHHKLILERSRIPSHSVVQWAVNFLAGHARRKETPMLVMIDEFQVLTEVMYPEDNRIMDITDSFQRAAESWDAPLLVSSSSVSMLREEALGGLLSGRFWRTHVGPLDLEHAAKMVFRLGTIQAFRSQKTLQRTLWIPHRAIPFRLKASCLVHPLPYKDSPTPMLLRKWLSLS
ncbi:MAG: ATP-binding protein [Chloroflexota bacterium]